MDFDTVLKHIFRHEGGLVNNPKDPGGITKHGISLRAYPELGEQGIRDMTPEKAAVFYLRDYWKPMHCDELPPWLRLMAMDCAVNQGVGFASTALQSAVNVRADGNIGPQTIAAAGRAKPKPTILKFSMLRHARYAGNKNWNVFGEGWTARLHDVMLSTMEK